MSGSFIVFEGGEKVGKTTQIKLLQEYLQEKGYRVVVSKEPGGGDPLIREKLLHMRSILTPEEELALFCEDRALHVENVIKPALQKGSLVLCDRFEPSTVAYQGYGRGMDILLIKQKSKEARQHIEPDLVILLDTDPEKVLGREEATSRFDAEKIDFHKKVREGFLTQAKENPARWRIIDANQSIEKIHEEIIKTISPYCP